MYDQLAALEASEERIRAKKKARLEAERLGTIQSPLWQSQAAGRGLGNPEAGPPAAGGIRSPEFLGSGLVGPGSLQRNVDRTGRAAIGGVSSAVDAVGRAVDAVGQAGRGAMILGEQAYDRVAQPISDYMDFRDDYRSREEDRYRRRIARLTPDPSLPPPNDSMYAHEMDTRRRFEEEDAARGLEMADFQRSLQAGDYSVADPARARTPAPAVMSPPPQAPAARAQRNAALGQPSFLRPQVSTPGMAPKSAPAPAAAPAPVSAPAPAPVPAPASAPAVGGGEARRKDAAKRATAAADQAEGQVRQMDRKEEARKKAELNSRVPPHVQRNARAMGYQGDFSDFNAQTYRDMKTKRRGERAREYGQQRAQARANVRAKIRPRQRGSDRNTNRTRLNHVPGSTPRHIQDLEFRREMLRRFGM